MEEVDAVRVSRLPGPAEFIGDFAVVFGQAFPVEAVHVPGDNLEPQFLGSLFHVRVTVAVRRAHDLGIRSKGAEDVIGFGYLILDGIIGKAAQVGVRVAVIAYLVSLGERAFDDIGIVSGVLAKHEECRVYACFIKHIQQVGGKRGRAIVESNSAEIFRHGLGAELKGAIEIAFGLGRQTAGAEKKGRGRQQQTDTLFEMQTGHISSGNKNVAAVLIIERYRPQDLAAGRKPGNNFERKFDFLLTLLKFFFSVPFSQGQLAQLVEHRLHTAGVASSSLALPTNCGTVVKSVYNAGLSRRRPWVRAPSVPP